MIKKLLKQLYWIIPGKQYIFSLWKFFAIPKEDTFRHLHFHGVFTVRVNSKNSFKIKSNGYQLENELFWGGLYYRYEKKSLRLWVDLCQQSQVIMDVGANSGLYSLVAKAVNRDATVHAFEPVDRVFNLLEENIQLNSYDVIKVKKALSNDNGKAIIYDTTAPNQYAASLSKNVFGSEVREEMIDIITMESYVQQNLISVIDLIKIDVERHEPEVLMGMGKYLRVMKPTFLIEIVEEDNARRIENLIDGLGYLFFDINETTGCQLRPRLGKSSNNNWLLCSEKTAHDLKL